DVFAGKKSAQIREILISESAWEEMTCLFAPSLIPMTEASSRGTKTYCKLSLYYLIFYYIFFFKGNLAVFHQA
ncbi:hypothetical protein, partial [Klebsiella pneumoniae]|uniref:hypothetical protein n=1 Tax=Klebsiella pneumoniae TaxID=573 RepID=UPI00216AC41F